MEEKVFKPAIFRAAPVTVSLVVTCTAGLALVYYFERGFVKARQRRHYAGASALIPIRWDA